MKVYRINNTVRVVIADGDNCRLTELPAGAIFVLTNLNPDSNGMIEGTWDDRRVLLFLHDLEERAEPMNVKIPSAAVRVIPELTQP